MCIEEYVIEALSVDFPVCVVGKAYITGGHINDKQTNRAEAIDVDGQVGTVNALPPMQKAREWHALAAAGSLLFAFGGWNGGLMSSSELYDLRTNK